MANKLIAVPKSDLKVLRMFANWSNSFQVFEDGRFEFGMMPRNSLNHLMVVEGWFNGKAPAPGHYSTEALKENGEYVVEENPFFEEPFIIDPNLESKELTKFKIPKAIYSKSWDFITKTDMLKTLYIIPIDKSGAAIIDPEGVERMYRGTVQIDIFAEPNESEMKFEISSIPPYFTIFPEATVNIGKPFLIRPSFIKAIPKVDYRVTIFQNHIMDFESEEHGFNIYLRGWMDEDHVKMEPYRSKEDDWLVGGTKRLIERFEAVHGLTENIKIKS